MASSFRGRTRNDRGTDGSGLAMTGVPDGSRFAMTREPRWIRGIQNGFPAKSAPFCAIAAMKNLSREQESEVCITG
jgi:hypothetical protein